MRVGATWAEALEGCLAGDNEWGTLAAYRTRLILAPIPKGLDRIEELNDRLDLWEQGRFDDLIGKIVGQQLQDEVKKEPVQKKDEVKKEAPKKDDKKEKAQRTKQTIRCE